LKLEGMRKDQAEAVRDLLNAKKGPASTLPKAGWVVEIRGYTYHTESNNFVVNTLVANLADLADLDPVKGQRLKKPLASQPTDPVKFPPDVERILKIPSKEGDKDVFKPRISHVFLYEYYVQKGPKGGDFNLITSSTVAALMTGPPPAAAGPAVPGPKGAVDPAAPKDDTPVRMWRPLTGTGFTDVFSGTVQNRPTSPSGAAAKQEAFTRLPPRTEFIVVFIWQEPVIPEGPVTEAGR